MKINKLLFGVLTLAIGISACGDPTGPRLPDDDDGDEDPPGTAYHATPPAAQPAALA